MFHTGQLAMQHCIIKKLGGNKQTPHPALRFEKGDSSRLRTTLLALVSSRCVGVFCPVVFADGLRKQFAGGQLNQNLTTNAWRGLFLNGRCRDQVISGPSAWRKYGI